MFEGWFFCSRTRRVDHCTSESACVSFLLFVSHLATLQNRLVWSRPLCQCDHKVVSALWEEYHPNIFKLYPLNEQNHIYISFMYMCIYIYIYILFCIYIYIYIYIVYIHTYKIYISIYYLCLIVSLNILVRLRTTLHVSPEAKFVPPATFLLSSTRRHVPCLIWVPFIAGWYWKIRTTDDDWGYPHDLGNPHLICMCINIYTYIYICMESGMLWGGAFLPCLLCVCVFWYFDVYIYIHKYVYIYIYMYIYIYN